MTVLANLKAGYDDSGPNKPFFLMEAKALSYWKSFKKAMYAEFQSLIENDSWEYKNAPSG